MAWQTVVRVGEGLGIAAGRHHGAAACSRCCCPSIVDRTSRSRGPRPRSRRWLRSLALLLTALTLAYAVVPRAPWPTAGPLPGYAGAVTYLFAGQAALLALLLLIVAVPAAPRQGRVPGGFGAPIVASLGLGLGAAFSAGASYRVADFLDGNAVPSPTHFGAEPAMLRLQPPVQYQWAAVGFVLLVLVVLLALLWVRFVLRPRLRTAGARRRPTTTSRAAGPAIAAERPTLDEADRQRPAHRPPLRRARRRLVRGGGRRRGGHRVRAVRHRTGAAGRLRLGRRAAQCPLWPTSAPT